MARTYYYTVASLPDLSFNDRVMPMTQVEFRAEMREQLEPEDYALLALIYRDIDMANVIHALRGNFDRIDPQGILDEDKLRYGLAVPESLPGWVGAFLDDLQAGQDKLTDTELERGLLNSFAVWHPQIPNAFLREWLEFQQNLANLLTGLNARRHHRDLTREVVGENYVSENVSGNREHDFSLGKVLSYVIDVVGLFENDSLLLRESELEQLRWAWLDHLLEPYTFSIENIMAYAIKLRILKRVSDIQAADGTEKLKEILEAVKAGYDLPEQFAS